MTQRIRLRDLSDPSGGTAVEPRELAIAANEAQLYAGYGTTPRALLPVRVWSSGIAYHALDLVGYNGNIFRARTTVPVGTTPDDATYWLSITGEGGLGIQWAMATEAEALAGTSNDVVMSPLRTKQSVDQAITVNNQALPAILGPYTEFIAKQAIDQEILPGESIDVAIDNAIAASAAPKLYFFDKAGDLVTTTVPAGVDTIYRLGYYKRGDHKITRFKRKSVGVPTDAPVNNLAWEKDAAGVYFINDEPEIDARTTGARGGVKRFTLAQMTAASNVFICSGAGFVAADIGKTVSCLGVGTLDTLYNKESQLNGIVTGMTGSPNSCYLSVSAGTTKTGQYAVVGWDDTTPFINASRAAATLERWAYAPGDTYIHSDSLTGIAGYPNFRLRGDGDQTVFIYIGLDNNGKGTHISVVGAIQGANWLTTPVSIKDHVLTLNTITAGVYNPGNLIIIAALDEPQWTNVEDPIDFYASVKGEVARIKSVDVAAKTLTLEAGIIFNYNANVTATNLHTNIHRFDVVSGLKLADVQIEHVSSSTNYGVFHVSWIRSLRPEIKNVTFKHTGAQCLPMSAWVDGKCHGIIFDYIGGPEALDQLDWGYGLSITGPCWQLEVYDCIGYRLRHMLTSGGGVTYPGPQHVHVSNVIASGCRVNFDQHEGGRFWTWTNCHAVSGAVIDPFSAGAAGPGFQIRVKDTILTGCTVKGGSAGFFSPYGERVQFINCHAWNVGVGFNILNSPGTKVIDCSVTNYQTCGVMVQRSSADQLSAMPGIELRRIRLYGNPTQNETSDQTQCFEPCGFQFGWWDGSGTNFYSQYEENWVLEDLVADGAKVKFKGLPSTSIVYGALKQDTVLHHSISRDSVTAALAALTSGTMFMTAIEIPKGTYITRLATMFGAAGVGQSNLFFGLYDRNLWPVGFTTDALAVAPGVGSLYSRPLVRGYNNEAGGLHYIGICWTGTGTPPTVYGQTLQSVMAGLDPKFCGTSNAGLTGSASVPVATAGTSTTPNDIRLLGPWTFTVASGLGYVAGQPLVIASQAAPTVNRMFGRVGKYTGTTLTLSVHDIDGVGKYADWQITGFAKATVITSSVNRLFVAVL